jgi:hypothetical protein
VIDNLCLLRCDESELLDNLGLKFGKIIYKCDLSYLDHLCLFQLCGSPDIIFLDYRHDISKDRWICMYFYANIDRKKLLLFHHMSTRTNDILVIKPNTFKICKIERWDTYYDDFYGQRLPNNILKCIKYIANDKSIFHDKYGRVYEILWKKYYLLINWKNIYPVLAYLIQHLNISTYSKDVLSVIFLFLMQLANKECTRATFDILY